MTWICSSLVMSKRTMDKSVSMLWTQLLLYLAGSIVYTLDIEGDLRDYCEKDIFHAECPDDEIVFVKEARYGRMGLGTCIKRDYGSLNCYRDVKRDMDNWCSGKQSCQVDVIDIVRNINPCSDELRSYLQASYVCLKLATLDKPCCQHREKYISVKAEHGYIANSVTSSTGCGSIDCPWHLEAPHGQRMNITLFDFSTINESNTTHSGAKENAMGTHCLVYAILKEESIGASYTLCSGNDRNRTIYTTSSNSLDVHIVNMNQKDGHSPNFIIEYTAFGCPDPTPPAHGYVKRVSDRAEIHCHLSEDQTSEIICQDGQWIGDFVNCTVGTPDELAVGELRIRSDQRRITPGILMTLIISLALIIAVTIVTIGIVCTKRHLHQRDAITVMHSTSTFEKSRNTGVSYSGYNTLLQKTKLLQREFTINQRTEIPWYLRRPLPKPDSEGDAGYLHEYGYESPRTHGVQYEVQLEEIKYYELDPAAVALSKESDNTRFAFDDLCPQSSMNKHRQSVPRMAQKDLKLNHKSTRRERIESL